jgi:hypothetical protein
MRANCSLGFADYDENRIFAAVADAEVAEPADALDSKSSGLNTRAGSTPAFCTQ